ncbi:MAG TPA: hypothetical protein VKX28_31540 [Xanthobacteraceae bacterium]|nr:hypothetical protein [Xanthobacteraceae bacterium]
MLDRRLARHLKGHEIKTARQMRWATIKKGTLLALAAEQFDVFVTVDRNLTVQQNIVSFSIAVIVLRARTNRLADLAPLVPSLRAAALDTAEQGKRSLAEPRDHEASGRGELGKLGIRVCYSASTPDSATIVRHVSSCALM